MARTLSICVVMAIILCGIATSSAACPSGGDGCRNCIVRQMKSGCPRCVTMLQCVAQCLWGGASRSVCTKKCDCGGGYPRLADCKKCVAQCKCSCLPSV